MRAFSNCSEPVRAGSHRVFYERFRGHGVKREALWVCYAMAENGFAVTTTSDATSPAAVYDADPTELARGVLRPAAAGASRAPIVSCGGPIPGCAVKVVDDQRRPLPDERVGEIALTSAFQLREYHGNPAATQRALDAEGWYHTGDSRLPLPGSALRHGAQEGPAHPRRTQLLPPGRRGALRCLRRRRPRPLGRHRRRGRAHGDGSAGHPGRVTAAGGRPARGSRAPRAPPGAGRARLPGERGARGAAPGGSTRPRWGRSRAAPTWSASGRSPRARPRRRWRARSRPWGGGRSRRWRSWRSWRWERA